MTFRTQHDLNGAWRLALDPEDVGSAEGWYGGEATGESMEVQVPSVWDLWVPDYDGVGWYFREFALAEDCEDKCVSLEFEAVDYYAEVWLNGERFGAHEGGYTPFAFDVTGAVRQDNNLLAVRVIDPHGPDGYGDFKPKQIPCAKEHGYFTFAGIWGSVRLVVKPRAHIADVFVRPDIRRKRITLDTQVCGEGEICLRVAGTPYETSGPPGTLSLDMPEFEEWSPESPTLYQLECELRQDGAPVDTMDVRFGMREFTVREGRFCLNHRPYAIRGVLHQPDYARTLVAPESEALARRELELAKEAGFNLVRLHIKTAPSITLDLADEIGLLVYEEPPIGWIQHSKWMKERCEREVREMVLRDRNHPSIVMWGMLNESGNAGYVVNGGAQLVKDDLCRLTRSLDPSRIVIDDSGGINATREPSRMMRPYHDKMEPFDDLHIYQRAPVDQEIELYYQHSGDPDALAFLSEFGFGGMEDLEDVVAQYGEDAERLKDARFLQKMLDMARGGFEARELGRVFGDFAGFGAAARELQCDAVRRQIDAIRSNPKMAGYCYTQLCDAGHEFCAGVLDRWRRPKPVFHALKDVQRPMRPIISIARTNLVPRQEVNVSVTLLNDDRLEGRVDLSLQVVGPTNQVLWKKKRSVKLPKSPREVWTGTISASGSVGTHRFVVRVMQGMKVLGQNEVELHVFKPVEPCDVLVNVVDPTEEWRDKCLALAKAGAADAPIHVVPPWANTIRGYPQQEFLDVLSAVRGGAVALLFGPPDDWNDLAEQIEPEAHATSKDAVGAFLGMYHYVKLHPVFEGLPARGLMRQPYKNVVPAKTFVEESDQDICGTFDTTPIASGNYMMKDAPWWGSDILVRKFGTGRLVFTHLRVLEHLGRDPVADRLFVNLLTHFSRRSVPSSSDLPVPQSAVEWLRRERSEGVRRWMVVGMFPNWGNRGHDYAYPPEDAIDFSETYLGWYKPVQWRPWYTRKSDGHLLDLQQALTPIFEYYPRFDWGTAYAYAEFVSDLRQGATLKMGVQDATKVWLNGSLVLATERHLPHQELEDAAVPVSIRQGRNIVLVKVSKIPGEFRFAFDLESTTGEPIGVKWWR